MYNTQKSIETYNMTNEQAQLAELAYQNLDTEIGYKALYDLLVLTKDNNLAENILEDLPMDFSWDQKLEKRLVELAKENNREDLFEGGENAWFPLTNEDGEFIM